MKKSQFNLSIFGNTNLTKIESVITNESNDQFHSVLFHNSEIRWKFNPISGLSIIKAYRKIKIEDYILIQQHLSKNYGLVFINTENKKAPV